jgi:hypothetical protein
MTCVSSLDKLGPIPGPSPHRVPVPDDTVDEAARQQLLSHPSSLDDPHARDRCR